MSPTHYSVSSVKMVFLVALLGYLRDVVFAAVLLVTVSVLVREGGAGLARKVLGFLRSLHGVDHLIALFLRREVRGFLKQVDPKAFSGDEKKTIAIPERGKHRFLG
jgi:hypothetical protein